MQHVKDRARTYGAVRGSGSEPGNIRGSLRGTSWKMFSGSAPHYRETLPRVSTSSGPHEEHFPNGIHPECSSASLNIHNGEGGKYIYSSMMYFESFVLMPPSTCIPPCFAFVIHYFIYGVLHCLLKYCTFKGTSTLVEYYICMPRSTCTLPRFRVFPLYSLFI